MLTEADINRIAEAVVRKLREVEGVQLDAAFEASLPVAEQKRRAREEMKRQDRERKAAQKGGV